jgi:SAM-dependent methyltransferase
MSAPPAYAIGQFRDADAEVARLRQQARAIAEVEDAAFRALGFPEVGVGVDVGCGPGFVAQRLRQARSGLRIIGLDLDRSALGIAREGGVALQASATALPIPSSSCDFAYARLVLRYLPDPGAAMGEMVRVVRPGGAIFVLDSDDGGLVVQPEGAAFRDVVRARQESLRRRGSDPCFARRLTGLFVDEGLTEIEGRALTVSSLNVGAAAFARLVMAPFAEAIDSDLMGEAQVRAAAEEVRQWPTNPGAFGMTTALLVAGRRRRSP